MKPYSQLNQSADLSNTRWKLNSLYVHYRNGFEALKDMFVYLRSNEFMIDKLQLEQFEYEIGVVDSCIQQLNIEYYNNYGELVSGSVEAQHYGQTDSCYQGCYLTLPSTACSESDDSSAPTYLDLDTQPTVSQENTSICTLPSPDTLHLTHNFQVANSEDFSQPQPSRHNKKSTAKLKKKGSSSRKAKSNETRVWYKCAWDGCSFGSFYNGVVKRHSYKRHSGEIKIDKSSNSNLNRFKCDWPGCEVSLVAYHKLVEHKRKHTGEKPFRCKWKSCNYATARLYSMIIHERTHKLNLFTE